MPAGSVYIFIRNTGAPQYTIQWKPASAPTYDPADFTVVNTNGVNFTTATITVSNTSIDYNIIITARCPNTISGLFYIYLAGSCAGVGLTVEWNNCRCPNIQNIIITE